MNTLHNVLARAYAILDKLTPYSTSVLRIVIGLVFIYFGYTGIVTPDMWAGFVPEWTSFLGTPEKLVQLHGIAEVALGLLLILGIQTRIIALLLFLNLAHIITTLEFGPSMVRDFGILAGLFTLTATQPNKTAQNTN